jgi:hypothetical protein
MQNSTTFYHISHYMDHCDVRSLVNFGFVCKNSYKIIKNILNKIRELSEQLYIEFSSQSIRMYRCVYMMKKYGLKQHWPLSEFDWSSFKFKCLYPEKPDPDIDLRDNVIYDSAIKNPIGFRISLENIFSTKVYDKQCNCYKCSRKREMIGYLYK